MTDHSDFLSRIRVGSPCPASWNQMQGDERVRFCELCDLQVYNVAQMTTDELHELVSHGGRVCGWLYRRSDGTVITRDCPIGLKAFHRRVVKTAGALLGMILGVWSLGYGQSKSNDQSNTQKTTLEIKRQTPRGDEIPGFSGVVVDDSGAVIVGAILKLKSLETNDLLTSVTDDSGQFRFTNLHGRYSLEVSGVGFHPVAFTDLNLDQKQLAYVRVKLIAVQLVGVVDTAGVEIESPHLHLPQYIFPKPLKRN